MRRVWLLRLTLIMAPFIAVVFIGASLEIGTRVYFAIRGGKPWAVEILPPIAARTSVSSRFSLPSSIAAKAIFPGVPFRYQSKLLDKSHGYASHVFIKSVYNMLPSAREHLTWRLNGTGETVHSYTVLTDRLSRRITPERKSKRPTKHLVFFGCSNTVGEGVEQNETIPYYSAEATKNYRAYNLGVSGGSIADAWAYTHVLDKLEDIPEKNGYAFYVFIDAHVARYKGDLFNLYRWVEWRPLVRPDDSGHIHFHGRYGEARPWFVRLSAWVKKSQFLTLINFNLPPVKEQDMKDFVKVVASVRDAYENKFGKENPFIFVFYFQYARLYAPVLKPLLEQAGIQYLDYSGYDLEWLSDRQLHITYDGHPNAYAHKAVGELIAGDLKLQ